MRRLLFVVVIALAVLGSRTSSVESLQKDVSVPADLQIVGGGLFYETATDHLCSPSSSNGWIGRVMIGVTNTGQSPVFFNPHTGFLLRDEHGNTYATDFRISLCTNHSLVPESVYDMRFTTFNPGVQTNTFIVFTLPREPQQFTLISADGTIEYGLLPMFDRPSGW